MSFDIVNERAAVKAGTVIGGLFAVGHMITALVLAPLGLIVAIPALMAVLYAKWLYPRFLR